MVSSINRRCRIATICARGGSKGLASKNSRPLLGRPLLAWSVDQAKRSTLFDSVVVTSDNDALLEEGEEAGADILVKRPQELSHDRISKLPGIVHAVKEVEGRTGLTFDTIVDLDATAPLRLLEDIAGAVDLLESRNMKSVITAAPARRSPYYNMVELAPDGSIRICKTHDTPVQFRQDAPPCYDMNASIYVWQREPFLSTPREIYEETALYVMPPERSHDIDSQLDFEIVEVMMKRLLSDARLSPSE